MKIKELSGHKSRPAGKDIPTGRSAFIRVHPWFNSYVSSRFDFAAKIS
jgi:hypothetical protein